MNTLSDLDFSDSDVLDFLAEQESQEIKPVDHWRMALLDRMDEPQQNVGIKLPWSKTHDRVRLRGGELSVWVGSNGHFKSAIVNQCALYATDAVKVGIMSFEMPALVTLERMAKQAAGTGNPSKRFVNELLEHLKDRMWIYDHLDTVDPEKVVACVHHMAKIGIKLIVVDCLIMVKSITRDAEKESNFIAQLTALAKSHDIHLALVHHIRKPAQGGDEYVPSRWDIRGASDIADMASTIFICWNNKLKADAIRKRDVGAPLNEKEKQALQNDCQKLIVAKQRNAEFEGPFGLTLNRDAMQFIESDRHRLHLQFPRLVA